MIVTKDFPDKEFATKEELFSALRESAEKIISVKKAEIHKSINCGGFLEREAGATKAIPDMKEGYVYPVINTTKYMDSHRDVHFDGIWNKTAKEQNGKIFYVTDHEVKIETIIAWPSDVNILVKSVPWSFVGKSYEGETEALIYEISKDRIVHAKAKEIIQEKRPVQNSVRMQYVRIKLAMNSNEEGDEEFKKFYDQHIDKIANKKEVEELGYFWGVSEAKIVTEGSMVVRGSNDATPIQQSETKDTANQPPVSTEEQPSTLNIEQLIKNFQIN
jgi:hypothetical protein